MGPPPSPPPKMASFYIVLPSNVAHYGSKANKTSHYITHLPRALELNPPNSWECGLVEFHYPVSWHNLTDRDICTLKVIHRTFGPPLEEPDDRRGSVPSLHMADKTALGTPTIVDRKYTFHIGPGHFARPEELLGEITSKRPPSFKSRLTFNKSTRKCTINMQAGYKLVLHPLLARMLGFVENEFEAFKRNTTFPSPSPVNPTSGFDYILIYTDIVKDSVVGTAEAPLLRTVPASRNWGQQMSHIFDSPHYMPVALSQIPRIEIKIAAETGNLIPFEQGKTLVKLHFRKKSPFAL